jgi:predicted membrane chloride channel (bestrophin family)
MLVVHGSMISNIFYQQMNTIGSLDSLIINEQSRDLVQLMEQGLIDDFRHMELTILLKSFYTHQGKNERIKKFPLPRQYANMSRYFVGIFIGLLPFSMIPELRKIGEYGLLYPLQRSSVGFMS